MKWSTRLGRFAGIDVYVHATFPLLLAWIGYLAWHGTGTLLGVVNGIALVILLFTCVLLHEYGHALTARRFGIGTQHITLLPIGGIALLNNIPNDPRHEVLIAFAGPAVNLAIAAILGLGLRLLGDLGAQGGALFGQGGILATLITANLVLAAFNLIPAFPMDGGRVLRALLALRLGRARATRIAALLGRVLAVGLLVMGLRGNPVLILIAAFVWYAGGVENRAVAAQARRAEARRAEAARQTTQPETQADA